ncbi:AAA family ATPase [Priestia megaterium]
MEICYYWIDKFGKAIENMGYNFGGELIFTFKPGDNELIIEENELYIKEFFNVYSNEKIVNLTAVVGENGVGKTSFLRTIKNLFIDGQITAERDDNGNLYGDKKILVLKYNDKYEIIYHKDLISTINEPPGKKYNIKYKEYGNSKELNDKKAEIVGLAKHYVLKETSCIYFSYAFDNNYYVYKTLEDRKYYDISTKGLLNQIEDQPKTSNTYSYAEPNHLTNRDSRFNVGFIREYSASENKKRVKLLNSAIGREFIKKRDFFPTKAHLNLDYLLHRGENPNFLDFSDEKLLLRSERNREKFNKIENHIYNYIEKMYSNTNDEDLLALAKQTYLRRIMDSYFEDVDRLIFFSDSKAFLIKEFKKIPDEKLEGKKNLLDLMKYFEKSVIKGLKDFSTRKEAMGDINYQHLLDLTKSYRQFIIFLTNNLLKQSPLIDVITGTTHLKETVDDIQGTGLASVGVLVVNLTPKGISLLQKFLDKYSAINTGSDFIKVEWEDFSTGQDALLGIYSRFFALSDKTKDENVIILLDEVEHSLHPEWQRSIIYDLIKFLQLAFKDSKTIQIIIATNVPFIIADVPTRNVIYLKKSNGKYEVVKKKGQTFASNIHSLLMNNFFMKTTIGGLSEKKIKDLVSILEEPSENKLPVINRNEVERHYSQEEIKKTIKTIGEPVIRNKLEAKYTKKYKVRDTREMEIKKLISDYQRTERNIPDNVKELLEEIARKSGGSSEND